MTPRTPNKDFWRGIGTAVVAAGLIWAAKAYALSILAGGDNVKMSRNAVVGGKLTLTGAQGTSRNLNGSGVAVGDMGGGLRVDERAETFVDMSTATYAGGDGGVDVWGPIAFNSLPQDTIASSNDAGIVHDQVAELNVGVPIAGATTVVNRATGICVGCGDAGAITGDAGYDYYAVAPTGAGVNWEFYGTGGAGIGGNHLGGTGSAPTFIPDAGCGAAISAVSITGNDVAFTVGVTCGATGAVSGVIGFVQYATAMQSAGVCDCGPANAATSSIPVADNPFFSAAPGGMFIVANTTGLPAGTYKWNCQCNGN